MDVCRVCLSSNPVKDIFQLQTSKNVFNKSYSDIILFCLDIQVVQNSKLPTKLCIKCYKRLTLFYKFKCVALKNDTYLRSIETNLDIHNQIFIKDDIKSEEVAKTSDESHIVVKEELGVKQEDQIQEYQSDDELLSVLKNLKYEYVADETKENVSVKRRRGRPRKVKPDKVESKAMQVCEECGKTVKNLKEHSLKHRPIAERKHVKCEVCDMMFSSHSAMYKHNKRKHLGIKQHCKVCGKLVTNLKQHHLSMHDRGALPFECVSCGRRFVSRSRLAMHVTVHTKERPHQCDLCESKFRTKMSMLLHRRQVHDKEKTHLCQFCSKSFFKKYHLQVHLRSHTKEKPYECLDCGKFFSTTGILKNHQMIHGEVKMFGCTQCDMTFVRPGYLRAHMISHTKEKRYECQYCGMKFHRSDHRKRHERTSHEKHQMFT